MTRHARSLAPVLTIAFLGSLSASADTIVTFDDGLEGWMGPAGPGGSTFINPEGGNPGANLQTQFSNFGIDFVNATNREFVQNLSAHDSVTVSFDLKVNSIQFFFADVSRPWLLEFRDYDNVSTGYPWVSVWYKFAEIEQNPAWTPYSVTIVDPSSKELPPGWAGYGDEDPDTFEPILPADRTFTDVLAGVDEVVLSTLEPGFFFGQTDFDLQLDNIAIGFGGGAIPGDLDGDTDVDFGDLLALLAAWGECEKGSDCPADLDGSGDVAFNDLLVLLANWT